MRITQNGQRNKQDRSRKSGYKGSLNAQDFPFIPTPPAAHMAETCAEFLVRLHGVGRKFVQAHPDSNLVEVLWELERLKLFCEDCEEKGTPTE